MILDWETYYDAAAKCRNLAESIRTADKPVHEAAKGQCDGMAGDAPGCKEWGQAYDAAARSTLQACASLANALTNYGAVLYAQGYNWAVANRSDPPPPQPDISQVSEYKVVLPPSARGGGIGFGDNGGAKAFFDDLFRKVVKSFGMIPNGDADKLQKAHETWKAFAENRAISGAADHIMLISDLFTGMDDSKHRYEIQHRLNDIRTSAQLVSLAAGYLAPPIHDYYEATTTLATACADTINLSEGSVGVEAVSRHGRSGRLFDVGLSESMAARGSKVSVDGTLDAIQSAYRASTMPIVLGLSSLDARSKGVVDAFKSVPTDGLNRTIDRLSVIIAMRAEIDSSGKPGALTYEKSPKHGKDQRGTAAPEPTHGQETLENSVLIKPTTSRRVGYDANTGEFDVFDETHPESGIYHGHQRSWDQLTPDMQNALVNAGIVDRKGKPR
ncbi:hypothetical protein [Nocardia sp. 852002-20019_SCH5090214]|uniref:hypothetical protein n=1 Tax=Nocardia sp. 852002-20019_SCH5090214 TaxID=1834087 RepID=UPI000B29A80E|nr:hypothetical protein [Nocardia sp. 852002-20019_SCH5090214]